MSNRVKELYDVACEYLSLPTGIRFAVGVRLHVIGDDDLPKGDGMEMDKRIFTSVIEKEKLHAFKRLVTHFQQRGGYGQYH